jgi:hypothetical protein
MKNSIILSLAIATISAMPLMAQAQTDPQYPAANFQPKVIFIDEAAAAKHHETKSSTPASQKTQPDPKYPAAAFEPKVIFP